MVFSKIYTLSKDKLPTNYILSWIYSVAKNESISLLRKKKNNVRIEDIYDIANENDEISKLLNKPTGTIKWKYYKSIYTLRLLLSNLGMFIVTFVTGLKTIKIANKGRLDYQTNSTEDKTNENNEQESITESMQYDVANNTSMKNKSEEQNTAEQESKTIEEIQIPVKEPVESINYYSIGIFAFSSIFLLFTVILLINYIKYQLKRKGKTSK